MSDIEWHEEVWPIEKIKGYDRNPRKISKEQFDRLTRAIQEVGFHHPIAVDVDGTIISGNQRFRALNQLGEKTVRVSMPSRKLTNGEFKQIVIQANISNGEWDTDILACDFDVEKLIDWGIPANMLGIDKAEPEEEKDEVPEPPVDPVSKLGDVWILGNHRLMCGDSTKADDVARLLGDVKPHLMVTDPPYGVEYDASWR